MNIGNQIKRLRKSKKMKQKDLAIEIGLSPVHYNAIENGRRSPSIDVLERVATVTKTQLVVTFID